MRKLITTSILFILATLAYAQQGTLDVSFSTDGKLATLLTTGNCAARSVAVQPDAKIIAAGYARNTNTSNDFSLMRFNTDGTPDTNFNATGKAFVDFGGLDDLCTGIGLQSNGKIIAGGFIDTSNGFGFGLTRLNVDGTLDTTFGTNGKTVIEPGITSFCSALAIQSDDKILLAGHTLSPFTQNNEFVVSRFNADGSIDQDFGTNGFTRTAVGSGSSVANGMTLQPDGKLILVGQTANNATLRWETALVRYNTDGSLDGFFGDNGQIITALPLLDGILESAAVQPDGKIVVAGYAGTSPTNNQSLLLRFLSDGTPDLGFANNGQLVTLAGANNNMIQSVLLQGENIVVAGSSTQNGGDRFLLAAFDSDGNPDTAFGNNGATLTHFADHDGINAMALAPDGKLVTAGVSYDNNVAHFALARYHTSTSLGLRENHPSDWGLAVYPNPLRQDSRLRFVLEANQTVSADWYDALGRKMTSVLSCENRLKGTHEKTLGFVDALPSGTYYLVFSTPEASTTLKLVK
ncbi:T9SS type A sorting domain-containing protein [Flavobacterium sp.]|uniref:T9SS type A sorting domain-containing protein n=1 Tax=Flavobacterium sp. TaxID=239 RepID=UPI0039E66F49